MRNISRTFVLCLPLFFFIVSVLNTTPAHAQNSFMGADFGVDANGNAISGPTQSPSLPGGINLNAIKPYSNGIINFINGILVPVLMAIAFIVFLYGVYKYFILGAADGKSREEGRQFVLWGIIGFVVILSVWGLVALVGNAFGLAPGGPAPKPPTI